MFLTIRGHPIFGQATNDSVLSHRAARCTKESVRGGHKHPGWVPALKQSSGCLLYLLMIEGAPIFHLDEINFCFVFGHEHEVRRVSNVVHHLLDQRQVLILSERRHGLFVSERDDRIAAFLPDHSLKDNFGDAASDKLAGKIDGFMVHIHIIPSATALDVLSGGSAFGSNNEKAMRAQTC